MPPRPGLDTFTQVEERTLQRTPNALGTGITLVEELLEMAVAVEAQSDDASGVRLQLASVEAQLATAPERRDEQRPPGGRKPRLLVVDDNHDALESLAILLEMMGFDVHTAGDGLEAVEAARALSPDVVLLDIGLPGLDGYQAAERIRALHGGARIVLVALTGWGQDEDRQRSREAGFDHHLVKPVDPDALEDLLRRVVPGGGPDGAAT